MIVLRSKTRINIYIYIIIYLIIGFLIFLSHVIQHNWPYKNRGVFCVIMVVNVDCEFIIAGSIGLSCSSLKWNSGIIAKNKNSIRILAETSTLNLAIWDSTVFIYMDQ